MIVLANARTIYFFTSFRDNPKNVVAELHESVSREGGRVEVAKRPKQRPGERAAVVVKAKMPAAAGGGAGGGNAVVYSFKGVGNNYKRAKIAAATFAVRYVGGLVSVLAACFAA